MARHPVFLSSLAGALLCAACASSAPPPQLHPVYELASVKSESEAWAAAAQQDQPVLILGSGVYGLSRPCIPQRYFGTAAGDRAFGSALDQRQLGSAQDSRQFGATQDARSLGSAANDRDLGAASDGRSLGAASDQRNLGAAEDKRQLGAAQDDRQFGSNSQGRAFGDGESGRAFGATESALRCRLDYDQSTILIFGAPTKGYLYSARAQGSLEGIYFQ